VAQVYGDEVTPAQNDVISVWRDVAGGAGQVKIEAQLVARHAEAHRGYHTTDHVMWVLRHVDTILAAEPAPTDHTVDAPAIRAGALFHDIVYDPRSDSNEADSAEIAGEALTAVGWESGRVELVRDMIEATATHRAATFEAQVLLDADLAVLGGDSASYREYVAGVRFEYGFVDDAAWRSGRAAVLRSFLDRDHIYVTRAMSALREAQARANMTDELTALTSNSE
jgi:predicted metal-dependent HD superfamily phosphohydrolase